MKVNSAIQGNSPAPSAPAPAAKKAATTPAAAAVPAATPQPVHKPVPQAAGYSATGRPAAKTSTLSEKA